MRWIDWTTADTSARQAALRRPVQARSDVVAAGVREIIEDIRARGAEGVDDWARRLDGEPLRRLPIDATSVALARRQVEAADLDALAVAAENIRRFHEADKPVDGPEIETSPGVVSRRVWRALDAVGLYVPAGTAPLFSTLLMLAIPAQVAGVGRRVVVTPPGRDGMVHPMMVLAAHEAGLEELWLIGGAQAIAALAFGAGLPRADKIFGPGNAWVAEAKRQVADRSDGAAIDLPAGPSELLVIADGGADPEVVAADLLGQAEHDVDAQVLLVTSSRPFADAVSAAVTRLLATLPRREIANQSISDGVIVLVSDDVEAVSVANIYGPEHLSLQVRDPERLLPAIRHAGAVFVGDGAAETFGDYIAGPSHVLPTDGAARVHSGVTTAAFMKSFSVQRIAPAALPELSRAAARLARLEGLEAHALAAEARVRAVVT